MLLCPVRILTKYTHPSAICTALPFPMLQGFQVSAIPRLLNNPVAWRVTFILDNINSRLCNNTAIN
jgi:hypothetical protein